MKYKTLLSFSLIVILSGCETLQTPRQRQQAAARQQAASRHAEERVHRVQGQVESVEMENARLMQDLQRLRNESAQLSRRMSSLEAKQTREMNELIKRVEGLLKKSVASRPSSKPSRGSGREHVVEAGHTLSAIAQAYGVSVKSIKRANSLKNDSIYVGQKLFIPE